MTEVQVQENLQQEPQKQNGEHNASAPVKTSGGGRPQSLVWQYYTKTSNNLTASKRYEVACNACKATLYSRVEQMEAHLASGCERCPPEVKQLMRERLAAKANKKAWKDKEKLEEPSDASASKPWSSSTPKRQLPATTGTPLPEAKRASTKAPSVIPFRLRFPQVSVPCFAQPVERFSKGIEEPLKVPCTEEQPSSAIVWKVYPANYSRVDVQQLSKNSKCEWQKRTA